MPSQTRPTDMFTVVVLGANGQLGSDIVRVITEYRPDWTVVPLTRADVDLDTPNSIEHLSDLVLRFDWLVNCTAFHKVEDCEKDPGKAIRMNALIPRDLAIMCNRRKARFLQISTDYVFGHSGPWRETDHPHPLNVYGASKLHGENMIYMVDSVNSLIVRVASLFGIAGSSGKGGNFVETMLRKAETGERIEVVNDICMSPTATLDAAEAIQYLISTDAHGVVHVVNSGAATWYGFAKAILAENFHHVDLHPVIPVRLDTDVIRPFNSALSNRRLKSLGFDMPSWQDGLARYLADRTSP